MKQKKPIIDSEKRVLTPELVKERIRRFTPLGLIIAEEAAREIRRLTSEVLKKLDEVKAKKYFPKPAFDGVNVKILRSRRFCESFKAGKLGEFLIVSPTRDFSLRVFVDGVFMLDHNYADLEKLSPFIDHVTAMEDTGVYRVKLSDYEWEEEFFIEVSVKGEVTFNRIYCTWFEIKV